MTYTLVTGLVWFTVAFFAGAAVATFVVLTLTRGRDTAVREPATAPSDRVTEVVRPADVPAPPATPMPADRVDVAAASSVLGHRVVEDDLTEIVGIEPHVAMLCHWIGIHTWRDLAGTPVEQLRTMLHDAGARFAHVDPSTWPRQAALLADGRWDEFAELAGRLRAGAPGAS